MCDCKIRAGRAFIESGYVGNLEIHYCPLHAAAEQLLATLNMVEWVEIVGRADDTCPWCNNISFRGHKSNCPRQAAIAAAQPKEVE